MEPKDVILMFVMFCLRRGITVMEMVRIADLFSTVEGTTNLNAALRTNTGPLLAADLFALAAGEKSVREIDWLDRWIESWPQAKQVLCQVG